MQGEINMRDYQYDLPEGQIAAFPLEERDQSKLLVYRSEEIIHSRFDQITKFLPDNAFLFFNDTKVIPARVLFTKDTGTVIEIFLLSPHKPHLVQQAMQATESAEWQCTIGNLKRWPSGQTLTKKINDQTLTAELTDREKNIVRLSWEPASLSFAEIIQSTGATPLPPYIKRNSNAVDQQRYQTVYSTADGAVAAPTAGLHFSKRILEELKSKKIATDFVTLHVSAGTFQPVKVANALEHPMHAEQVLVTKKNIENLLVADRSIVAVGTTSLRTLETLYWFGVRLIENPDADFIIHKLDPYELNADVPVNKALRVVYNYMERNELTQLQGETSIMIVPGYKFKIVKVLITNFHQPGSTLMLLVAAFVGPAWRKVYNGALAGDYRFLSYGDSSILFGD